MPHVVVIGGGFGGLSATETLAKEGFRVTLIDRHPYNTFQPLLYQVATGGLNAGDVTYSLRYFSARYRNVSFRRTTAIGLDHEKREVLCDDGVNIGYDYLIVANGITTNHFGIPGAAEYSVSMYTRAEALRVRDMIFGGIETIAGMSEEHTGGFTVVVVGGGATGVEIAGQLAELKSHAVPVVWPELNPALMHVVLVEMGPALLAPFDDKLRRYTLRELVKRGVDVRLKTAISEVHADRVDFKGGQTMQADLVIWAAGVSGYPLLRDWGLPLGRGGSDRGQLRSDHHQRRARVRHRRRVRDRGQPAAAARPAGPADRQARRPADHPDPPRSADVPFEYYNKGTMATIGRADAVVQLPNGLKLTGIIAWLGWIALHIMFLLGSRNRVQTLVNLAVRYSGLGRSGVIVGDVAETPRLKAIKQK